MTECLLACGLSLPVTVLMIMWLRAHAPRFGLVDEPGGRKHHHGTVPLVGGLGMFAGVVVFVVAGVFVSEGEWSWRQTVLPQQQIVLLGALALLVLKGYLDDRYDLRASLRFMVQALAVLMMIYWGDIRLSNLGNLFGWGDLILNHWAVPMTIFGVLGVINAVNMIDGVDGLAGGLAFVSLLALAGFALAGGFIGETLLLPLLAAVIGFMLFNARTPWRPQASVFMGEAGSVLLGFSLAWYAVDFASVRKVFTPITAVWILAIPLMDTIALMVRRVLKGRSPLSPDREHLHHILQRAGFSQCQTVSIVLALSALLASVGIVGWYLGVPEYVMFYAFVALFCLYLYGVMHAWKLMKVLRRAHGEQEERTTILKARHHD